jgi:hypothetical protein
MRKASQDNGLIVIDDKFIGIALGYDYCAEHEWGIKDLKRICGMPEATKKNMGVKNRTITKCPPLVFREETHKNKKFAILYTSSSTWQTQEELEKHTPHDFKNWVDDLFWNEKWNKEHPDTRGDKDNISTAWDGGSFGVTVMGEKEVEYLKELKEALQKCNVTIAVANLRAKNPFAGSSLCLMITDRIPKETADAMYHGDKEYFDREDYEEKIGMKKIIEKNGNKNGYHAKNYFCACSPKWIDYNNEEGTLEEQKKKWNTKYDILYWVNYSDDDENYGWYIVEEIKEWLTGNKKLTEIRRANGRGKG